MNRTRRSLLTAGAALAAAPALSLAVTPRPEILIITTSIRRIPGTTTETGMWWSEYADAYDLFIQAGQLVRVASIQGGDIPIDPRSADSREIQSRSRAWAAARATKHLAAIDLSRVSAIYLPGGFACMWDLPNQPRLARILNQAVDANLPIAAVCHGPAAFVGMNRPNGEPFVKGRRLTAFSDAEERAADMADVVPFLLESRLRELGGNVTVGPNWQSNLVEDGQLITGQNPRSTEAVAKALLARLRA